MKDAVCMPSHILEVHTVHYTTLKISMETELAAIWEGGRHQAVQTASEHQKWRLLYYKDDFIV